MRQIRHGAPREREMYTRTVDHVMPDFSTTPGSRRLTPFDGRLPPHPSGEVRL
jgi:hypothetical protein